MLSSYASNAVLSKARAMYGKRLRDKDYQELCGCSSVTEVALYLKNSTNYKSSLENINEHDVHRGHLEVLIKKKLFSDFASLGRYELSSGELLYEYIIKRAEISQIMTSLMLFTAGRSDEYIYSMPMFFNKHTRINLPALGKIKNYDDFLDAIKFTTYYKLLKDFKPVNNEPLDLTLIETTLHTDNYKTMLKSINAYKNKDVKTELLNIFNSYIDLSNFIRIMRLKKYYKADSEYIKKLILHVGSLSQKQITSMIQADSTQQVIDVIKHTYLSKWVQNIDDNTYIDELPNRVNFYRCRHNIHFSIKSPVVILSYIILSEIELSNIINIIEGVRYGLPKKEINDMLIYKKN